MTDGTDAKAPRRASRGVKDPREGAQRALDAFVVRARRVEAHSLAQDREKLLSLANDPIEIDVRAGKVVALRRTYPAEEVVESAAARVRPIILEKEACYYRTVLSGLGLMLRDRDPRYGTDIKAIRKEWDSRVRRDSLDADRTPTIHVANDATGENGSLSSVELGLAWIYGDVVHHDKDRRHESRLFGLRERFGAAVPLVAFSMLSTIRLLDSIRRLHEAEQIEVSNAALTEQVVLESTSFTHQVANMHVAELGTPPPTSATEPLGDGWSPLNDDPSGMS